MFGSTHEPDRASEFGKFGVETTFVSQTDVGRRAAVRPSTKLLFAETPTNPLTEVRDIRALADVAHGAARCSRSTTASSLAPRSGAAELGADLIIHSGTKHLDGPGPRDGGRDLRVRRS